MQYAKAVWKEDDKEMEGTAPLVWINMIEKTLRWPKTKVKFCFLNHIVPKEDWAIFQLVKVKFTSGNLILFIECIFQSSHIKCVM